MLQKMPPYVERCLRLADLLENMPPERFDMDEYGWGDCGSPACIAGWAGRFFDATTFAEVDSGAALGISEEQASILFNPGVLLPPPFFYEDVTPAMAARVLRHLAITGRVEWGVISPTFRRGADKPQARADDLAFVPVNQNDAERQIEEQRSPALPSLESR